MLKCPFCSFDNEDGALFCEQCKSDLSGVEPAPVAAVEAEAVPMAAVLEETVPMAQAVPAVAIEPTIPVAEAIAAPVAEPAAPAPVAEVVETPPPPAEAPAAPAPTEAAPAKLPAGAQPRLVVIRGQKIGAEYLIYPDLNFIGRADDKPVDIDLEDQEPPDRVWCSRQHALITFEDDVVTLEDLNSSNGTFVNRTRVYPGQKRPLNVGDTIQIGNVQMKLKV